MDTADDWGRYAPPRQAEFLRLLVAAGFGRGAIRKRIEHMWMQRFGPVADVTVRGVRYRLDLASNVTESKILLSSRIYDGAELRALGTACRGGTFVDVGANIGYYALTLARVGAARVVAIEPNPPTVERLTYNVSINGFRDKVTIVPAGVGAGGPALLSFDADLGGATLREGGASAAHRISIETRPLLDIVESLGIGRIDGLKIDVEGMEDAALLPFLDEAPASLWPRCVVIEHCHRGEWKTDVIDRLLANGYVEAGRTRSNAILARNS